MARRRSPTSSGASRRNTSGGSLLYFRRPNLGDKLQRLAGLSPRHVHAVEMLVDQMLKRLRSTPEPRW